MDSKLTLKLDDGVIEKAKRYAKENNISLSKLIENYLQAVSSKKKKEVEVSSLVESLTGVFTLKDKEYRKDYSDFLSKKYK
ncbi:MAG: DUF6364 family protein [Saprospiraceae bacterium]